MLGRYLDVLPTNARDRLLHARLWTSLGYVDGTGGRSLLGHAEDWYWDENAGETACHAPELFHLRDEVGDSWLNWPPTIDVRFDHLVDRLGLPRAVALLRSRAERNCSRS